MATLQCSQCPVYLRGTSCHRHTHAHSAHHGNTGKTGGEHVRGGKRGEGGEGRGRGGEREGRGGEREGRGEEGEGRGRGGEREGEERGRGREGRGRGGGGEGEGRGRGGGGEKGKGEREYLGKESKMEFAPPLVEVRDRTGRGGHIWPGLNRPLNVPFLHALLHVRMYVHTCVGHMPVTQWSQLTVSKGITPCQFERRVSQDWIDRMAGRNCQLEI